MLRMLGFSVCGDRVEAMSGTCGSLMGFETHEELGGGCPGDFGGDFDKIIGWGAGIVEGGGGDRYGGASDVDR